MLNGHFRALASGGGKKERTRAALVDAAIKVVAEKGMDALKISDITTAADMANGTFYNHFEDKDEILREAAYGIAVEISRQLDAGMAGVKDGPTRVALATWRFIEIAVAEPDWAAVLLDSADHVPQLNDDVAAYMRSDLQMGVTQGKFDIEVTRFLVDQIMALIGAALRRQLQSGPDKEVTREVCENILRMLGMTPAKARKIIAAVRAAA